MEKIGCKHAEAARLGNLPVSSLYMTWAFRRACGVFGAEKCFTGHACFGAQNSVANREVSGYSDGVNIRSRGIVSSWPHHSCATKLWGKRFCGDANGDKMW
jgi:hypothetical protein